jgi:hypothetical protein
MLTQSQKGVVSEYLNFLPKKKNSKNIVHGMIASLDTYNVS